jgi:hypothetical protein
MYKLTKVWATDPVSNKIKEGNSYIGEYRSSNLKVGERLYFVHGNRYMLTSVIKEINDHPTDKNTKVIITTYSIYHLTKL